MEKRKRGEMNSEKNRIFSHYKSNRKEVWSTIPAWNKRKQWITDYNHSIEGRAYQRKRYIDNKENHILINKIATQKRKEEFPLRLLFTSIKSGAKRRKLEFDIDINFILDLWNKQNGLCYYTNIPMKYIARDKDPFQVSIDRIDSSRGYFKDNVVLCCQSINYMKNNYTIDIFYEFLNKLCGYIK